MATPTEPVTGALFQALSSPEPDPKVVHAAIEEVRQIASQNVIVAIGAQLESHTARIGNQITELKAQIDILAAKIDSQGAETRAEIKAQTARIDVFTAGDLAANRSTRHDRLRPALPGSH